MTAFRALKRALSELRRVRTVAFPLAALMGLPCVAAKAQTSLATISVGSAPAGMAVNPATNTIYVLNSGSFGTAGMTVIAGATGSTTTVNTGSFPQASRSTRCTTWST